MISFIYRLSKGAAILGTFSLVFLTILTVVSVIGGAFTWAGLGPVQGEYELVEIITGVAIFFFMPWADLSRAHATVDLVYNHLPRAIQKALQIISDLMLLILWSVLTWMLWKGLLDKYEYTEATFILHIPLWWAYSICLFASVVACFAHAAKLLVDSGLATEPEGIFGSGQDYVGH